MKFLLEGEETQRLKFRLLCKNDYNNWLELFKYDVAKFLGMGNLKTPEEQCDAWFKMAFNRYENELGGMNALIDKKSNKLIGQCGILVQTVDELYELEIGYSILPQYWNKGFASEAARKCRDYAFTHNFSESLISTIHIDNTASEKVAINNGMKLSKTTTFKDMPANVFRINKNEWKDILNK